MDLDMCLEKFGERMCHRAAPSDELWGFKADRPRSLGAAADAGPLSFCKHGGPPDRCALIDAAVRGVVVVVVVVGAGGDTPSAPLR